MSLIQELKRRNVIRVAGLYLIGAWLITQVSSTVLPMFGAPDWLPRSVVILLAIGFVPALIFAWVFELTPQGIKRDAEVLPDPSIAPRTAQRMNRLLVAGLVLALVYFGFDRAVLSPRREAAAAAAAVHQPAATLQLAPAATAAINAKSIAVLPFENLSDDKSNAYFATGMQDEILTRLAGIHDLKVISRTSTVQYASHPPNLRIVAEQLGVATVLEGSVQKADGKVRINLQLIDARNDSHLWAQKYDRDLKDVFALQSDVAEKVADALQAQLLPAESARIASVPTKNPAAYDQFLKAEYFARQFDSNTAKDPAEAVRKAGELYASAIAADPDFALAYARLAYLKAKARWNSANSSPQLMSEAQAAAAQALALQPNLAEAHLAMGYVHYWGHREYAAALAEFAIARASLPNDANVTAANAFVYRRQGKLVQAIDELQRAIVLDPRDTRLHRDLGDTFGYLRRYAEAEASSDRALALAPDNVESLLNRVSVRKMRGDIEGSSRLLAAIPADYDPVGAVTLARFDLAMVTRQPDAAFAALAKAPALLADTENNILVPAAMLRGQALAQTGDAKGAHVAFLEARQALLREPQDQASVQSNLAFVYLGLGQKDGALIAARRATELLPVSQDVLDGTVYLARSARIEAQVGQIESALKHVEQLLAAPAGYEVSAASLRTEPVWDPLRKDSRFEKLIADAEHGEGAGQ
jgi:TolB-like protein/Flp pilus assembly protein TadD